MDSSDERSFVFDQAGTEDREQVLSLYHSVIGSEYCTWNANYPSMYEIQADIENADLFVFRDGVKIIGAISIVPENELDALEIWRNKDGKLAEIARVAVAPNYQGKGLALIMVRGDGRRSLDKEITARCIFLRPDQFAGLSYVSKVGLSEDGRV